MSAARWRPQSSSCKRGRPRIRRWQLLRPLVASQALLLPHPSSVVHAQPMAHLAAGLPETPACPHQQYQCPQRSHRQRQRQGHHGMQRVDVDVGDDDEVVCLASCFSLPSCIARFCFVMLLVALLCSTLHCFPPPLFCYLIRGHAQAGLRVRRDSMSPTFAFFEQAHIALLVLLFT